MSHFGVQLIATEGYRTFRKGERYYFAGDGADGKSRLAWFHQERNGWRVYLIRLDRGQFEQLLTGERPKLTIADKQLKLPQWLTGQQGVNFDAVEGKRYAEKKQTYRQQATGRLLKIAPALEQREAILQADDPLAELSRIARQIGSGVHPHRLQLWFFAYILHRCNLWALKKSSAKTGKWDRTSGEHAQRKYGRPSADEATCYNAPTAPHKASIVKYYLQKCGLGESMMTIHRGWLTEVMGCIAVEDQHGNETFVHPDGGDIISYDAFNKVVVKEFGLDAVRETKHGAPRIRATKETDTGNYTAQYSKVLGGFEVDAYYTARLAGFFTDEPAEPLSVARGMCTTTSGTFGVGFAIGAENKEAYRAMLFCAVAPKPYIAKIYGIPPEHFANWRMEGLPSNFRSDRGPAGSRKLVDELAVRFPMKSIVPSYAGQSKALVESGHPRDVKLEGAPSYLQSELNSVEMMKQELYRANRDNHSRDISDRLSDEQILEFLKEDRRCTPQHYVDYLTARLRTCANEMPLEEAVRAFWTPTKFSLDRVGVRHRHRSFASTAFTDDGLHERLLKSGAKEIDGYCFSAVVRYVWIEVNGRLIELEATTRARVDGEDLHVPLSDLVKAADALAKLRSKSRTSAQAVKAKVEAQFEQATGKKWDDGSRRPGKPKRPTGIAAHEAAVTRGKTKCKKEAA